MSQFQNIETMENILNNGICSVEKLSEAFQEIQRSQSDIKKLFEYYGSDQWFLDRESYDNGKFSHNLCCGVLTEDAVYDLQMDYLMLLKNIKNFCEQQLADYQ